MFAPYRSPASTYQQLGTETAVSGATPHRLIEMLFEGVDTYIARADEAMARGDFATKGEAITRAIRIVDEGLSAALELPTGELAQNLRALYTFVSFQLLDASRLNDRSKLAVARRTLAEIHAGWSAIGPDSSGPGAREAA